MSSTPIEFQQAWIADLKAQPVFSSGTFPLEIREAEWQGTDFTYPNVRVSLDFLPSINGCGPDAANVFIDVNSEEKSSMETATITSAIIGLYHKQRFKRSGIDFSTVIVRRSTAPSRSIYAWTARIFIYCEGTS